MNFVQMAGFPATGKSTLAKALANEIGAVVVDRDIVKTAMLESGITGEILNEASYKTVYALCDFYLSLGLDVILDTPCYYDGILSFGNEVSKKYGANYKFIECHIDSFEEISNRLLNRERLETQIFSTTVEQFENSKGKSKRPCESEFVVIDTSRSKDVVLKEALAFVGR